ncbi:MAG: hypothetical protein HF974_16010, partial [ANME-2 cluster archaeon]|nr:hypothetical protein [ANME-2 cluster archaeon]
LLPDKGYGMRERYEGKLSRTVLRGLGAGNGLRLLDPIPRSQSTGSLSRQGRNWQWPRRPTRWPAIE